MSTNYFKDQYSGYWNESQKREESVKRLIESETGLDVSFYGLGAGSNLYIPGSAKKNGFKRGDPDLYIKELDYYIEVTGSHKPLPSPADLWIRPDKLVNAQNKCLDSGTLTYFVHIHQDKETGQMIAQVLRTDKDFFHKWAYMKVYKMCFRFGHGKFYAIPYNDEAVMTMEQFIKQLKPAA